jgi:hypothetical protein
MAESTWQEQLTRLQEHLEALAQPQIDAWAHEREAIYHRELSRALYTERVFTEHGPEAGVARLYEHLQDMREDREWRAYEQTLAYAREQQLNALVDEAIARVTSPEYLGEQAERRFLAEQDPASDWYREDLYHGQPGPDVIADRLADALEEAQRQGLVVTGERESDALVIDTSHPQMEEGFQELLDRLDKRLDDLADGTEEPQRHREQERDQGRGY